MKCWRCGQEINDSTRECVYCHADQRRSVPTTDVGQALRQLYDHYGADAVLSNNVLLVNGLGDVVNDTLGTNVKKIKNQLRMGMDAGLGRLYKEQLSIGKPDDQFYSRAKVLLIEDAGLNDKSADEIFTYFDEMIGWRDSVQSSAPQRGNGQEKEAAYQNAFRKMDSNNRSDLEEALRILHGLSGYKDADQLAQQCRNRIEELAKEETYQQALRQMNSGQGKSSYENALRLLRQISGYKDTGNLIRECQRTIKGYEKRNQTKTWAILGITAAAAIFILITIINSQKQVHISQTATAVFSSYQTKWVELTKTANVLTNTLIPPTSTNTSQPPTATNTPITPTRIPTMTPTKSIYTTPRPVYEIVNLSGDVGVLVRIRPALDGDVYRAVYNGTVLEITGETVEADGLTWVSVKTNDGIEGWVSVEALQTATPVPTMDPHYEDLIKFMGDYLRGKKGTRYEVDEDFSSAFDELNYGRAELSDFGYVLYDLDRDGKNELIFGSTKSYEIYDIYTIRNNSLVHLISGFYRFNLRICKNNEINFRGSASAFDGQSVFYSLENGKLKLNRNVFNYDSNQYYVSYGFDNYVFDTSTRPYDAQKLSKTEFDQMYTDCNIVYFELLPF